MATFNVHTSPVTNSGTYTTASGTFANPTNLADPITWYGQIGTTNSGTWTELDGQIGGELGITGEGIPTNTAILASGFTALTSLALQSTNSAQATVSDTMSYSFSSAIPTGTQFYLWDPGSEYNGNPANATFTFSISVGGQTIPASDLTLSVNYGYPGYPQQGTYTVAPSTGVLTVSNYIGAKTPEAIVVVTVDRPIDKISVTASTIGNDVFGFGLQAPGAAVTDSVAGVGDLVVALPMATAALGAVAQPLLNGATSLVGAGTLVAYSSGTTPTVTGTQGTLQQVDTGGVVSMATTDTALIIDATSPVTAFGGAAANETVVSALASLFFVAGSGSGTVVSGGGPSTFIAVNKNAGNYVVDVGSSNNVILTAVGDDTVNTSGGNNLIWLGTGTTQITSNGADTIVAQAGAATVTAGGTSDLAFGGTGGMQFIGGAQASTVVGLGGALTVSGGAGGGFFFGGPAGGNLISGGSGKVTIFGGGAGDVLSAGSGGGLLSGGAGAETITAAGTSGNVTIYGGYGPEQIFGGAGSNTFINGPAASTMYGGTGSNTYFFIDGRDFSPATIVNFSAGRDYISLQGFGVSSTAAASTALKTAVTSAGSTTITLGDGVHVTFAGVSSLSASSFV